jgi:hypothetical protein
MKASYVFQLEKQLMYRIRGNVAISNVGLYAVSSRAAENHRAARGSSTRLGSQQVDVVVSTTALRAIIRSSSPQGSASVRLPVSA